jgi:hypothetical protein
MLRSLVVILVLVNAAFYGWTQGWLDGLVGVRAHGDREPQRLQRQVRPEVLQILGPAATAAPPGAAAAPPPGTVAAAAAAEPPPAPPPANAAAPAAPALVCLETAPLSAAELKAGETALKGLQPEPSWTSLKTNRPGLWMVYLGKFSSREALLKRQEELRAIKVEFDDLRSPPELTPGLSLGRFEERSNAGNAQEKLSLRGIKNTKIVEVRAPSTTYTLRFERASPELAAQVAGLNLPALAKGLSPCAKASGN